MIIIDGKNATMGRLASYVAKQALRGEKLIVLNCKEVIITGNRQFIKEDYQQRRRRVGSNQKGPRVSQTPEKIVKKAIRGMLPNHRWGRGKEVLKKIKCYNETPKEFEDKKKIVAGKEKGNKYVFVKDIFDKK